MQVKNHKFLMLAVVVIWKKHSREMGVISFERLGLLAVNHSQRYCFGVPWHKAKKSSRSLILQASRAAI